VLRVFDSFLEEGSKILYRVALGLIKIYHHQILQIKNTEEFWREMKDLTRQPLSPAHLMKVSFSIDFLRSDFTKLEKKNKRRVSNLSEPHYVYYRPKIIQSSSIIPDEEVLTLSLFSDTLLKFEIIWSFLLDRYRILDPKLLYYSGNDGFSLRTVLAKTDSKKPTLVLIKTNKNAVFGAYLSEEWRKDPSTYFGGSESFVFSLHPHELKYGWAPGNPNFFAMVTDTTLSIGHG
jgi:hypothetical protein